MIENIVINLSNLTNLTRIDFIHGKQLPTNIGDLYNLEILSCHNNKIIDFPISIKECNKLKYIYGYNNKIEKFDRICDNNYLIFINLDNNTISNIPKTIGRLKNLEKIFLRFNNITKIDDNIFKLKKIIFLVLSSNRINEISEMIGNCVSLQTLDLNENNLKDLPNTISNLKVTLTLLDLRDNPINEYGEGTNLGRRELIEIFNDKVLFDNVTIENEINETDVYNKLKVKELCFNFDKMVRLKNKPIFKAGMEYEEALYKCNKIIEIMNFINFKPNDLIDVELINKVFNTSYTKDNLLEVSKFLYEKKYINKNLKESEIKFYEDKTIYKLIKQYEYGNILRKFIFHIFNIKEKYNRWPIPYGLIETAKDLLCFILETCNSKDPYEVTSNMNEICNGLKYCPDRQLAELRIVYDLINGKVTKEETLEEFIRSSLIELKSNIIELTFTPIDSSQNVHVLNYWKYELRDILGIEFNVKTNIGTMGQDKFNGRIGSALNAFYSKFTPEYVISRITEMINSKPKMICLAGEYLFENQHNEMNLMFNSEDNDL